MSAHKLNHSNFDNFIENDKAVLIDFYADWCGPCKMMMPIVEEIAKENPRIAVGKVNIDESPELARRFGIISIPTIIVMRHGEIVSRVSGVRAKAHVMAMLN